MTRDAKGAELSRLATLTREHEEAHNLPQRGFTFADSPSGTDAGRTWRFGKGVTMTTIDAALAYQRQICREYGINA